MAALKLLTQSINTALYTAAGDGKFYGLTPSGNSAMTGSVSISGTETQGQTLTASNTLADTDGIGTVTYKWYRNGTYIQTADTYLLAGADVGAVIGVEGVQTDGKGNIETSSRVYTGAISASGGGGTLLAFPIALSTAGRLTFYVDYSELSGVGTHTFYVQRTHGTTGPIGVDYLTSGDSHTVASGTLAWADGEADIKSFTATVTTKASNGLHVIMATLSNPTGGAVLHNGARTIAYGVIDDGTVPADADAVFYDSAAGTGTGTAADPYGSIYTAIAAVEAGVKRYLIGKGTTVPDGTNSVIPNGGGGTAKCIFLPTGRSSEANRLYLMVWPGSTWTITGGAATDTIGFYSDGPTGVVGDSSYLSFRGIDFTSLDCAAQTYCEGGGIGYYKNACSAITVEYCTFSDINGSTNTAGLSLYHVDNLKAWRCTSTNIQVNGSNTNGNAGGLCLYYASTNLSFQRCETSSAGTGFYFKGIDETTVMPVVKFCIISTVQVGIDVAYGTPAGHPNYAIIQGNLFKDCTTYQGVWNRGASPTVDGKIQISNNVFSNCGGGDNGAIYMADSYDHQIYNNIFLNCRKMWDVPNLVSSQSDINRDVIEYADYNHDYGTTLTRYEYLSITYATSALLTAAFPSLAANDSTGDPLFTNPATNDYSLGVGSPCLANGIGGTDQGLYFTGIEALGA